MIMKGIKSAEILTNPGIVPLSGIPELSYPESAAQAFSLLSRSSYHCVNYFARKVEGGMRFFILIANDDSHKVHAWSHFLPEGNNILDSLTLQLPQLHVFEREIHEKHGVDFMGHPWLKPLRYPYDRHDLDMRIKDYPFYTIASEETHEVGVGPVHAGVIEPGHFRFICYGEKVLHLEIQLGYQHRGIENLFTGTDNFLKQAILSESIAGDTAIGHSLAYAQAVDSLRGKNVSSRLERERIIALELERMAIHLGDTAALCGDVAYQPGQAACEALRTIVINTMQDWCGNRFGKGLIRPSGSYYPLGLKEITLISERLSDVKRRYSEVADLVFNDSGVLSRFEGTGIVLSRQALLAGAVGMAARSSGISRDIRKSHPFQAYRTFKYPIPLLEGGDVLARAMLRKVEFDLSYDVITRLIGEITDTNADEIKKPDYSGKLQQELLCVSMTEGWRGEICHSVITDGSGRISLYKIKDPSVHNWHVLALAVRDQEISDFPLCNKSFNLSYCGNDL
jgi:Ni,Fe-hydrogenase III large subunit